MVDRQQEHADFQDLLQRIRGGDSAAMAELVARYEHDIHIIARGQLGRALRPYLDSIDIVQSVHKSLMVGLRAERFEFTGPDKLIALAAVMVRRKVARHWRKMRRQNRESGVRGSDQELPDFVVSIADRQDNPADTASHHEQVNVALNRLEGVDRELVALRLEGYSTVNAAERLGLNPDVARVRLSRLRRKLKETQALSELL